MATDRQVLGAVRITLLEAHDALRDLRSTTAPDHHDRFATLERLLIRALDQLDLA